LGRHRPLIRLESLANLLFLIIGFHKPSSKKRVLDSRGYLESRGHAVQVREIPAGFLDRLAMLSGMRRYDLVVIQKKLFGPLQFKALKLANRNLVYDMDDAVMFHEIERREPVTGKFFARFASTAARCRGVIAGNGYLAEFARVARGEWQHESSAVLVLPTPVDTRTIVPKVHEPRNDGLRVGWIGTRGNLEHLKSIAGPLGKVLGSMPGSRLKVVSDAEPQMVGVPLEYKSWRAEEELADLQSFDVGIMPLVDNLWTRGKGGFKLLQYMAAGAPAVASPVGINREILRHGENGFLAVDDAEWETVLRQLLDDIDLRRRVGLAGRATVERSYALEQYNRRLAEFLESLV
jgi:glycosyltransferase involved in cell wall biosynthesis